jgi:WD40 repeat protein
MKALQWVGPWLQKDGKSFRSLHDFFIDLIYLFIYLLVCLVRFAVGNMNQQISVWNPQAGGSWTLDNKQYKGHTSSIEDIQWSPSEATVFLFRCFLGANSFHFISFHFF